MRSWKAEQIAWALLMALTLVLGGVALWQRASIARYLRETGRDALLERAARLEAEGDWEAAREVYSSLVGRYAEREDVLLAYATFLDRHGPMDQAERMYARAAGLGRAGSDAVVAYGAFLRSQGSLGEAVALLANHCAKYPQDHGARLSLGEYLLESGHAEDALAHFEKAIQDPDLLFDASHGIGRTMVALGRIAEAIPYFEQAVQSPPERPEALGRLEPARQVLQFDLGRAYAATGKWEAALGAWSRYLEFIPHSWLALRGAIEACEKLGREPDAAWRDRFAALTPRTLIDLPLTQTLQVVGFDVMEQGDDAKAVRLVLHIAILESGEETGQNAFAFLVQRREGTDRVEVGSSLRNPGAGNRWRGESVVLPVLVHLPEAALDGQHDLLLSSEGNDVVLWRIPDASQAAP